MPRTAGHEKHKHSTRLTERETTPPCWRYYFCEQINLRSYMQKSRNFCANFVRWRCISNGV